MKALQALSTIPAGLRDPLVAEYQSIIQNYLEHRWSPSELSGGRFCEIVFTILQGYAGGQYASAPAKPRDFVSACRALESKAGGARSFQILIPRALPTLYDIRNNRGVGHVGGDVDPNHMDATLVVSSANWIMAELVRVFHDLTTSDAQKVVDALAERTIPIVWEGNGVKRVLKTSLNLKQQTLALIGSSALPVTYAQLLEWTEYSNKTYFKKLLRELHKARLIEFAKDGSITLLPPGAKAVAEIVKG